MSRYYIRRDEFRVRNGNIVYTTGRPFLGLSESLSPRFRWPSEAEWHDEPVFYRNLGDAARAAEVIHKALEVKHRSAALLIVDAQTKESWLVDADGTLKSTTILVDAEFAGSWYDSSDDYSNGGWNSSDC